MRKLYVVKNVRDFEYIMTLMFHVEHWLYIIKNGKCLKNNSFVIYFLKNKLPFDRFGISVGKKLGNAVFRNKYKRKIRAIVDKYKKQYNNSSDYIIMLRKNAIKKDFLELTNEFYSLINKSRKE